MTKIKICGLKTFEHAMVAVNAGADYLGFVFATSKRQVTPDQAKNIIEQLPNHIKAVGVFVDESLDKMIEIATYVGLDILQLHGNQYIEDYSVSPFPIIKSVSIKASTPTHPTFYPDADYLLFDTWHKDMAGGCGESFDWSLLSVETITQPFFLAGGLNHSNIKEAIRTVKPYAVDISSGVETKGHKDSEKIQRFIRLVKECSNEL